jgi:carboxylate-amine ligase
VAVRSVGVEEELLLIDAASGQPRAVASAALRAAGRDEQASNGVGKTGTAPLESELQQEQLETATVPCASLDELESELRRCRLVAARAAQGAGVQLAAVGTSPVPVHPTLTPSARYRQMAEDFGMTAQEQLTCGCHVHVQVASDEEGTAVLDRLRLWLPPLLAISANSPFWHGRDSGYASFRYQAWGRWPSSGPAGFFGSARAYNELAQAMTDTGTILDQGMIYFDARLSRHYPTLEIRIADVCLDRHDAVLLAGLARALVETAARAWQDGAPARPVRTELLRLAAWRASRSGLDEHLVDPLTGRPSPASDVIMALVDHVKPALTATGDFPVIEGLLKDLMARGNGASLQRAAYRRAGQPLDVVRAAVARTLPG